MLLVEIAGGQAPRAENSIPGSHKVISFMGSAVTALGIHLLSLGDNAHESPLKANKALTLSTCPSCYLALSVHIPAGVLLTCLGFSEGMLYQVPLLP